PRLRVLHSFPPRRSSDLSSRNRRVRLMRDRVRCASGAHTILTVAAVAIGLAATESPALAQAGRGATSAATEVKASPSRVTIPLEDRKSTRLNSSHVKISY